MGGTGVGGVSMVVAPVPGRCTVVGFLCVEAGAVGGGGGSGVARGCLCAFFSLVSDFFLLLSVNTGVRVGVMGAVGVPGGGV